MYAVGGLGMIGQGWTESSKNSNDGPQTSSMTLLSNQGHFLPGPVHRKRSKVRPRFIAADRAFDRYSVEAGLGRS